MACLCIYTTVWCLTGQGMLCPIRRTSIYKNWRREVTRHLSCLGIRMGSIGQPRCGHQLACYGVFEDGLYRHCQVAYDQSRWQQAMDEVKTLDEYPDFRAWLKEGMVSGFGVGKNEPWTTFAAEGYR